MIRTLAVLCALTLSACSLFTGGRLGGAPVADPSAEALAGRIDEFYARLQDVPLDARMTWQDPELREYFPGLAAFNDYYASLANQARSAGLRDTRLQSVEVIEFRIADPGRAFVDVRLVGHHERRLRFWDIQLDRTDTWSVLDGVWYLTPDAL